MAGTVLIFNTERRTNISLPTPPPGSRGYAKDALTVERQGSSACYSQPGKRSGIRCGNMKWD